MLPEPAFTPDDTQPGAVIRSSGQRLLRSLQGGWPAVVAAAAGISLLLTVLLFISIARTDSEDPLQTVTLIVAGSARDIATSARTVGDLLAGEHITLAAADTVSYAPETPLVAGMQIVVERARPVTITLDGRRQTIYTTFISPYDILKQAGITLNPTDRIWIDGTATEAANLLLWAVPPLDIVIRPAVTLTIVDNGTETMITSAAETIGAALFEAGITLFASDTVTPDTGEPLTGDVRVVITRGPSIVIEVDNGRIATRVQARTVGEALAQAGVALVGLDYVLPESGAPVTDNMTIRVIRVTEDILTEEEVIPFESVYQARADMELDTRAVVQTGLTGIRRYRIRVRYEDGQEIGREPAGDEITVQPVTQIIAYGTKIVLRTIDTPEGPREYWRKLRVYATSYHPEALGGDDSTALGMKLEKGMIAADPRLIPWGTNLYVPEYGLGIMGDTGGARRSRYWIDLGYSDTDYVSWHRYTDIYLLTPVPDEIPYLLPEWRAP